MINKEYLIEAINKFRACNIAIIGDLMLDKYIFGKVDRISPEAPIPIIKVEEEKYVPGGAANVAANISTLGGNPFLHGILGNDTAKKILLEKTENLNINNHGIIVQDSKTTIQKIRIIAQNQQLLRIDYEDTNYIDSYTKGQFVNKLKMHKNISVILISDYAKGTITNDLMENIKTFAKENNILIIADPKPLHKAFYKDVFLITPNKKEAEEMCNMKIRDTGDVEKCGKQLMNELKCNVVITNGEKGMSVFENGQAVEHIPTKAKEVFDVSGAGDTVVSAIALALSSGISLKESAYLANLAAGIKVAKVGTAPVCKEELINLIETGL
ncbi:MAG: D-glycero-beta-D-manno-heptose-7-phosphate kinase [Bacteroidetes bacterium]|jgi:D-beta-D-heptose 7-phosphate kinase/D-beta-D-heptose 1-phosphate adenosyltransferase|nr:D-glycero-beta-D-manno-heptose-7-phosphate kinase [Bacteroidota bacterium]MBT6686301.1 D-glycero-beta-D-manno-heptose-7-phosphate kinase [Bacteroidota bacterium]MBT7145103.1 D-glycero-beta-D-manno-heptose-7-phosphate kinase [Bacteroidota bacterium]MBT7490179.1 D-glycero-beta-D-manno-heptose-7-phosphate kinase [Bacteroidota bacterium]